MLVLSRGPQERIVFPTLGVNVEIVRVDGNRVRVGIDAPREIPVLRDELVDEETLKESAQTAEQKRQADHEMRNDLNTAQLALTLAQKQLEMGRDDDAMKTLHRAIRGFDQLEQQCAPPETKTADKHRALLVEDVAEEREMLAKFLELKGFDVDTAEDGLQALVYLSRSRTPDVVLMDLNLPNFSGIETIGAIRENPDFQAMRVYAVTGRQPGETPIDFGPQGVNGWFQKPIDADELVCTLQEQLPVRETSPLAI